MFPVIDSTSLILLALLFWNIKLHLLRKRRPLSPSAPPSLPPDVLLHIVLFLPRSALPSLAATSLGLRDAATRRDVTDGRFALDGRTENQLVELAGGGGEQKQREWFAELGDVGKLPGTVPKGVTVGVLRILKYGSRKQLEAMANLCGKEEGFDDPKLHLEARKRLQRALQKAWGAEEVAEEEVLDGALKLGEAYGCMKDWENCRMCYWRAKQGFVCLLGEDSAKAIDAAYHVTTQILEPDAIVELKRLWEIAKVSLPNETITYTVAHDLGSYLNDEDKYEESKKYFFAALEGRRRVLGDEHKLTLDSLNCMGGITHILKDFDASTGYYNEAFRGYEKVLGKTHPETLMTIFNMGNIYAGGLKDFVKAEEMYRLALDGFEKSLGKGADLTKNCARNLALLFLREIRSKEKLGDLVQAYPHLVSMDEDQLRRDFALTLIIRSFLSR